MMSPFKQLHPTRSSTKGVKILHKKTLTACGDLPPRPIKLTVLKLSNILSTYQCVDMVNISESTLANMSVIIMQSCVGGGGTHP